MTPLSRYDPNASTETGMIAHSSGDWVPFDEALARIAELEAERKRLRDWMDEAVSRVEQMGVLGLVDDADLFDVFREATEQAKGSG